MAAQSAAAVAHVALSAQEREDRIIQHLPLVRVIAHRVRERLPVQVELDDLVHAGVIGLFDAVDRFQPDKNVVFHLYAKHRIRGAILDSLRQLDWASRDQRKRFKSIDSAVHEQGQKLGLAPDDAEVASGLGITEAELIRQKRDLQAAGLVAVQPHKVEQYEYSMTLDNAQSKDELPDGHMARQEMREALNAAITTLPTRYQKVISMYYREDWTMKEIGRELGVNESRVSQIHKAALHKLSGALRSAGYSEESGMLADI
ncbi:MAG: FliA/WhiG family RNA polymerase sigma factor [Acidobacteria bacterium]|nr:FliA/WhiG family RNA polymerase sigma factor [Acidobacteriota bacterium]